MCLTCVILERLESSAKPEEERPGVIKATCLKADINTPILSFYSLSLDMMSAFRMHPWFAVHYSLFGPVTEIDDRSI